MRMRKNTRTVTVLLLLTGLVGCNPESNTDSTDASARPKVSAEAAQIAANMVSAVSASAGPPPVEVKFELVQRPEVGKPTDIALVFIPTSPLERLFARVSVGEGLELIKGEQTAQIARPVVGSVITHSVTVMPKRDGIFYVQLTMLMDSEMASLSRTFSIPLIAGTGIAEWAPKKVVARGDDAR